MTKILSLFGTRPEIIKLAPVIRELESRPAVFTTINVASGQHLDLALPFVRLFGLRVDHNLAVMQPGQTPSRLCSRVLELFDPVLVTEAPDVVLVQGDTTTALAGALAAFHRQIPVGHVEAGLRSGNPLSPFPEEMNRRLISQLATYHFAPTRGSRDHLVREGVEASRVYVTGNPVVDALEIIRSSGSPGPALRDILQATHGLRRIVLTTHRRESFGLTMTSNLRVLRDFVERHPDTALLFPIHPNPAVVETTEAILTGHPRIHLMKPLGYDDFIALLSSAWLIVSDSGGVQEEAPTLGRPLLILRENTERPEAVHSGVAKLVGSPDRLDQALEDAVLPGSWADSVGQIENPFGQGDAGRRIASIITEETGPRHPSMSGTGSVLATEGVT